MVALRVGIRRCALIGFDAIAEDVAHLADVVSVVRVVGVFEQFFGVGEATGLGFDLNTEAKGAGGRPVRHEPIGVVKVELELRQANRDVRHQLHLLQVLRQVAGDVHRHLAGDKGG